MDKKLNITYESNISNIVSLNSSFDSGILKVAYTGLNRNNSFINEETFEKCIKTIYNCPVVCNYNRETNSIGGHDIEIISNDNEIKFVNVTQPVGVVPESAKYWWEDIVDNGTSHRYLCVDVLIWKRQEAYEHIKSNKITKHSMEIDVLEGSFVKDGYYNINNFAFTALTLLESVEPCFESSALHMFSIDEFKEQYSTMMKELKEFTKHNQSSFEVDIETKNYEKGGQILEDIKVEDEVVEVEENQEEIVDEPTEEIAETVELEEAVVAETADDTPDEIVEENKEEVVEEPQEDEFSLLQKEFENYKLNYSTPNSEVEELKSFKENVLAEQRKQSEDDLFGKFEKQLSTMEEFTQLKENAKDFTIENLEEKLFALLGKKNASFSFKPKDNSVVKVPFETKETNEQEELYGGLFAKYSKN